jgi:transposase
VCEVKALACQLPSEQGLPITRFSCAEIQREAIARGIVAQISETTIWRILSEDAIRPWSYRSWIFPRDPQFAEKAGRVLDLYHGLWEGQPLGPNDHVLCADEKTGIQIRQRRHRITPPAAGQVSRVEHEYRRLGTCAYLAAWDVRSARLFGEVVDRCTIVNFDAFVDQVMAQEPYCSARRVFWVVDNGTVHRGEKACGRLKARWPNLILVHLPIHASWLNQIEIYFSVVKRKALVPDDFRSREAIVQRIGDFQIHYERIARPFEWKFTRQDLQQLLAKCAAKQKGVRAAA